MAKKKYVEDAINELTKDMSPQFEFLILEHDKGFVDLEKGIEWCDSRDRPFTIKQLETMCDTKEKELSHINVRKYNYPSIKDQLDDIYHNGIDGWKATIKAVKDKYPKKS